MCVCVWITIDLANLELLGFPACSHGSFSRQSKAVSFALQPVSWAPICPKPLQPLAEYLSHWSSSNVLTALAAVGFPRPSPAMRSMSQPDANLVGWWLSGAGLATFLKASMAASRAAWFMCSSLLRNVLTRPTWSGATTEFHYHLSLPDSEVQRDQHAARVTVFQLGIHNPWVLWKICPSHFSAASFTTSWKSFATPLDASPLQIERRIERRISAETASSCASVQVTTKKSSKIENQPHIDLRWSQSQSSAHFGSSFSIRVRMATSLVR